MQKNKKIIVGIGLFGICASLMCKVALDEVVEKTCDENKMSQVYEEVVNQHAEVIRLSNNALQRLSEVQKESIDRLEYLMEGRKIPRKQLLQEKERIEKTIEILSAITKDI